MPIVSVPSNAALPCGTILVALGLLAACQRRVPSPSPPASALAHATAALVPSSASPAPSASHALVPPSVPIDRKAYAVALAAGRVATAAGRYDEADVAFTRALAAFPNEPRALAERGYAELLAEDLEHAATDLGHARDLAPGAKLSAQIWFNLGLLAEKRTDDAAARVAFARSLQLAPTGAARTKLAARDTCGAVIERRADSGEDDLLQPRVIVAHGWLDAYQQLYGKGDPNAADPPSNEAEAKQTLCVRHDLGRCATPAPWVLSRYLNSALGELEDQVFPDANGALLIYHAGMILRETGVTDMNHLTCLTEQTLAVHREPGLLVATVTTDRHDWEEPREASAGEPCGSAKPELEDVIYDTETRRELLRISRAGGTGAAAVHVAGRSVELTAGACRATLPLAAP